MVNKMSFSCEKIRKARKEHRCDSCGSIIAKHYKYSKHKGLDGFGFFEYKFCRFCSNLLDLLDCQEYDPNTIIDDACIKNILLIDDDSFDYAYCKYLFGDKWLTREEYTEMIASFNRNENNDSFIVKGGSR